MRRNDNLPKKIKRNILDLSTSSFILLNTIFLFSVLFIINNLFISSSIL